MLGSSQQYLATCNGPTSNFRGFLQYTLIRARGFAKLRRLGIVRDADRHPTGAFQSVQTALSAAGLPSPTQPWEFFRKDILTVSIAILPDGKSEGNLEELCLRSIQDQPEMSCIEQYIGCMADAGGAIAENRLAIAKVCAYLAVGPFSQQTHKARPSIRQRREPGLRLGESAENGMWDWNSRGFAQVVDYLNNF